MNCKECPEFRECRVSVFRGGPALCEKILAEELDGSIYARQGAGERRGAYQDYTIRKEYLPWETRRRKLLEFIEGQYQHEVTSLEIATEFGARRDSAGRWVRKLRKENLVREVENSGRGGKFRVYQLVKENN